MNLKNLNLVFLAFGLLLMFSCKDEAKTEVTPAESEVNATSTTEGTTAALNPEHGQPGHRCDIPVGTPLDQAKATNTQQSQAVSPTVSPVWTKDAAPAKNPAHGQPGHRCDIPVGADLNS